MPATITTRAITIHMRRRAPDEPIEAFRERDVERQAQPLRHELSAWAETVSDELANAMPTMPDGVVDRAAEIWEPLLATAEQAGGHWPATARAACEYFVKHTSTTETSLGVRLLADLHELFTSRGVDRMTSAEIVATLTDLDEAPWADLNGRPLDNRRLAKELGRYGVVSKNIKQPGGGVQRGYRTDGPDGLAEVWRRYLPESATSATAATSQVTPVAANTEVAATSATDPPR
jgi:hypothetical protein